MNNPRANIASLIAAGGGAVLILSLFIGWFGAGDESVNGWESFTLADILLFAIALAALALGAAHATGQAASLPDFLRPSLLKWFGTVALTITALFTFELTSGQFEADMKFGAILAVLASAAILAGGILSDRPDLAAKLNEATAGIGGGGQPAGAGPATPGAGAPYGGAAAPAAPAPPAASPPAPAAEPQQPATAPQPAAQPAAQPESSGPAPGWYPDPQGQKRLRYWDGSRWTEQTAD